MHLPDDFFANSTAFIDDERGRQARDVSKHRSVFRLAHRGLERIAVLAKILLGLGGGRIGAECDDGKAARAVFVIKFLHCRHLVAAVRAPTRPEVYQDHFTTQAVECVRFAVHGSYGERRNRRGLIADPCRRAKPQVSNQPDQNKGGRTRLQRAQDFLPPVGGPDQLTQCSEFARAFVR